MRDCRDGARSLRPYSGQTRILRSRNVLPPKQAGRKERDRTVTSATQNSADTLKALDALISGGDLRKAGDFLTDDFQFVGVGPQPMSKAEALGVWTTLRAAMPDFNHNLRDLRASGNMVYGVVEVTGTQTGTLNVPNGPTIAPTGRAVRNPAERIAVTVRNGAVCYWEIEHVPGGGLAGVLAQIS